MILYYLFLCACTKSRVSGTDDGSDDVPTTEAHVMFEVYADSDPLSLAEAGCEGKYQNCIHLSEPAIELYQSKKFDLPLNNWTWNEECRCNLPPRLSRLEMLQYLHIPKSGWFCILL